MYKYYLQTDLAEHWGLAGAGNTWQTLKCIDGGCNLFYAAASDSIIPFFLFLKFAELSLGISAR